MVPTKKLAASSEGGTGTSGDEDKGTGGDRDSSSQSSTDPLCFVCQHMGGRTIEIETHGCYDVSPSRVFPVRCTVCNNAPTLNIKILSKLILFRL